MKWIKALRRKRAARRRVRLDSRLRRALISEMNCDDPTIRARAEGEWAQIPR